MQGGKGEEEIHVSVGTGAGQPVLFGRSDLTALLPLLPSLHPSLQPAQGQSPRKLFWKSTSLDKF